MARTVRPLRDTQIKSAKPKDKDYILSDGHGLQLRIKPNGSKLWHFFYYSPYDKKRKTISLGKYPMLSLIHARKAATEARELLAQNIDPKEHRDHQRIQQQEEYESTFGVLAQSWLELKKQQVKPETAERAYRALEKHILPQLEKVPVSKIRPKQIITILEPVKAKGNLETVKRLCRIINEVMRLAVAGGHIEVNYLTDVTKLFPSPNKSNMASITPDRLPELMNAINTARITRITQCLLEWQLHTMTRPVESATAEWAHINFDANTWTIPEERMKMKRAHTVPLTKQMIALLDVMRPISGGQQYIFPSHRDPKKHCNTQTANMALKRMGFKGELVSHGLRSLASTTLNEQGFDADVIEACLAHIDRNEVRRAYNRTDYLERRRKIMEWWSDHIEQASYGNLSVTGRRNLKVV
ncbi:MAG: integrase domain-containing protein [Vibrio sp.]